MTTEWQSPSSNRHLEAVIRDEIAAGERPDRPIRRLLGRVRAWVSTHPRLDRAYRALVGVIGASLVALGVLLIPLPGPGWLVVFLGLAVLGTEFPWARRIAHLLKRTLDRFWAWWRARRARKAAANESLKAAA